MWPPGQGMIPASVPGATPSLCLSVCIKEFIKQDTGDTQLKQYVTFNGVSHAFYHGLAQGHAVEECCQANDRPGGFAEEMARAEERKRKTYLNPFCYPHAVRVTVTATLVLRAEKTTSVPIIQVRSHNSMVQNNNHNLFTDS